MPKTPEDSQWQQTLRRLGLSEPDITQVRNSDILYLAQKWAFLQVVEASGKIKPLEKPELLKSRSGWTIIYFGDAMATSPGEFIYGGGDFRISAGNENASTRDVVNPGHGTIIKQILDSSADIVRFAQEFGWDGIQIVDGHPDMQRAAWIEACRIGVKLDGYVPDMEAEKKRRRVVSESLDEMREALKGLGRRG